MARPNTGKLDQKITLQTYSVADDGAGGKAKTWADFATDATPWAHVVTSGVVTSGVKEEIAEGGVAAGAMTVFTIRNRADVDERDRIVWGGENYNIRGIRRMGARELYLVIDAERGVAT